MGYPVSAEQRALLRMTLEQLALIDQQLEQLTQLTATAMQAWQDAVVRLMEVPGIRRVRSTTFRGATEISAQFEAAPDMIVALQQVQGKVDDARQQLPADTDLVIERLTPAAFPMYILNLTGSVPGADLYDYAFYVMRPRLARVPGAGQVAVEASDTREIEVVVDPNNKILRMSDDLRVSIIARRGIEQMKEGIYAEAQQQFEAALKLDRSNSWVYYNLGLLFLNAGNREAAVNYFAEALWLDADSKVARDGLAAALNR